MTQQAKRRGPRSAVTTDDVLVPQRTAHRQLEIGWPINPFRQLELSNERLGHSYIVVVLDEVATHQATTQWLDEPPTLARPTKTAQRTAERLLAGDCEKRLRAVASRAPKLLGDER